ncbi:hypothetical protein [Methylobacterium sp. 285MFTsu5.1]|uniref:hypothetical protein n=1 Tax=Methylobacterium sp. 285MFTsu5.1 TaxID=1172187 RepID=UPI00036D1359|nr:hypothetical protein [Methylobacterium sp. 285MFTsu5.1]
MNAHTPPPPQVVDLGVYIAKYLQLRDKIKAIKDRHKAELAPYNEAKEVLEGMFLRHLNTVGSDSSATKGVGTVYRTTKRSATIQDIEEFRKFVLANGAWDLVDFKANAPAVADFVEQSAAPPPGVNFSQSFEVGVRRS